MIRLILHIILLIALAVFVSLNVSYRTTVNLFGAVLEDVSVVAVVLLALVAGVLYSFLTYTVNYLVRRRAHRQKERAVRTKEKERELREREKDMEQLVQSRESAAPEQEQLPGSWDDASPADRRPAADRRPEKKRKPRPSAFGGR